METWRGRGNSGERRKREEERRVEGEESMRELRRWHAVSTLSLNLSSNIAAEFMSKSSLIE